MIYLKYVYILYTQIYRFFVQKLHRLKYVNFKKHLYKTSYKKKQTKMHG